MIKYGVWLIAGKDVAHPLGSWCIGDGEFAQKGYPLFTTEDINWAYKFREHRNAYFQRSHGSDAFEVKEYIEKT